MSDDDEYYEWDEDYLLEDLVPDLVVSDMLRIDPARSALLDITPRMQADQKKRETEINARPS
jgi:hypothetical protein